MKKDFEIEIGKPFEYEFEVDHNIIDNQDPIDPTTSFEILDEDGNVVLDLSLNYGLGLMKFDDKDTSTVVISIYETDVLPTDKKLHYSFQLFTLNTNKKLIDAEGNIVIKDFIPELSNIKRPVRPWDLLKSKESPAGERVSEKVRNERFEICKACPKLIPITNQCMECGCFMKLKTKLSASTCPLGKW